MTPGEKSKGEQTPLCAPPGSSIGGVAAPQSSVSALRPVTASPLSSDPRACLTPDTLPFRTALGPALSQAFALGLVQVWAGRLIPFQGRFRYFLVQVEKCSIFTLVYMQTVPR